MSGTLFALLLFGCSDDGTVCQRLPKEPAQYASQTLCEASVPTALEGDVAMSADSPSVIAKCVSNEKVAMFGSGPVNLRKLALVGAPPRDPAG